MRMQSHLSLPGVSQAMMTQHVAVQAARALVGQVPAAFNAGLPGFQLLPAGVEVAAAAARAARAETTQSGQLQSLMDRAREPAGSQATAVNQLALPAPQAETLPGNVGPSEVVQPVASIEAAPLNGTLPAPAVPQAVEQLPSSQPLALEAAVEDLALAHYGRGVGDGAEDPAVSKRPAAKGMRKPASAKAGTGPRASPQKRKAG